jgi:uncharacterized DUF497 family protein
MHGITKPNQRQHMLNFHCATVMLLGCLPIVTEDRFHDCQDAVSLAVGRVDRQRPLCLEFHQRAHVGDCFYAERPLDPVKAR